MIRPVDAVISQHFGDNPTANILPGSPDYWIIEKFGNYQPDGHTGEDYAVPIGTPVRAVADGTVLHIGWVAGTYADNPWWVAPGFAGYCAVIDHGPFIGIYGHCSDGSAMVPAGASVVEGQAFVLSGNTGGSTGPHLHFEVLPNGYVLQSRFYGRVDPEPLFGTISAQSSTITPIQEDSMSQADVDRLYEAMSTQNQQYHEATRKAILDELKPWIQGSDNATGDRVILDARAQVAAVPNAVLNAQFTLPDGTVTNLPGLLSALNAKPAAVTNVTGTAALDIDALVTRLKAELPAAVLTELTTKLSK